MESVKNVIKSIVDGSIFTGLIAKKEEKGCCKTLIGASAGIALGVGLAYMILKKNKPIQYRISDRFAKDRKYTVPSREQQLKRIRDGEEFDLIVIGGGATGTGVALDAVTRGLKVCMLEWFDFASGTSSRTTKMAHGGVRYLQRAIDTRDVKQLEFVYESLRERKHFLKIAPFLVKPLELLTPCFSWKDALKNWVQLKLYDLLGRLSNSSIMHSFWVTKGSTLKQVPMLKGSARSLKGSVSYSDAQFNDSRMTLLLALTAASLGACVLNHAKVVDFVSKDGKLCGVVAQAQDEKLVIKGKVVINAGGYFVDSVKKTDDHDAPEVIRPSSGVHVVLDSKYCPGKDSSMLIPYTTDGRVMYVCTYEDKCLVGTTESKCQCVPNPGPTEDDIQLILKNLNMVYGKQIKREDVISSWAGIRPLVNDPKQDTTAGLSRGDYLVVSKSGLVTICGGKFTTFRKMGEKCIEYIFNKGFLPKEKLVPSEAHRTVLLGAETFQDKDKIHAKLLALIPDQEICTHLLHYYGDKAFEIAEIGLKGEGIKRIHPDYHYTTAEVIYCIRNEYAITLSDMVATRLSIMYLDLAATHKMLPDLANLMAKELSWSDAKKESEISDCQLFISQCCK